MTIDIYQDATTQHEHSGYLDLQIDHSAVRSQSWSSNEVSGGMIPIVVDFHNEVKSQAWCR